MKKLFIITKLIRQKELKKVAQELKDICPLINEVSWVEESRNGNDVMGFGNFETKGITDPDQIKYFKEKTEKHPKVKKTHVELSDDSPGEMLTQ
jgi:hypothetical protein